MKALIGRKVGMTQLFGEDGSLLPATLIEVEPNVVVARRTDQRDGYSAVVLGTGAVRRRRLTKPYRGQFRGSAPTRHLIEVRNFAGDPEVGATVGVELFADDALVDVRGTSKGKGFQGVIKRHGFAGGNKTHGSKFHRGLGSTGQSASPSKVFKGKRMPGRMGGISATVHNLRLVGIDAEKRLLLLGGPCPGARGSLVLVTSAKRRHRVRAAVTLAAGVAAPATAGRGADGGGDR